MSEMFLSVLIAVGILASMFVWVPMLHICNAGCQRFFRRRPEQRSTLESTQDAFKEAA